MVEINFEYNSIGGESLTIQDTSVYGNGTTAPARNQCLVHIYLTYKGSQGDKVIEFDYVPSTVSHVLIPIEKDGWYVMYMTVTKNPEGSWVGDNFSEAKQVSILIKDRLDACIKSYAAKTFLKKPCGCECDKDLNKWYCIKAQATMGLEELVATNDMFSAQMVVERLKSECELLNKDCGC